MGFFRFFGALSPAHIMWVTLVCGAKPAGVDPDGNRYFRAKPRSGSGRERRWVMYRGEPEASKIPPEWHGWIHHQTDAVPDNRGPSRRRSWQKPPSPNPTGTEGAYRPPGHILAGGRRDRATGDYEAWMPPDVRKGG